MDAIDARNLRQCIRITRLSCIAAVIDLGDSPESGAIAALESLEKRISDIYHTEGVQSVVDEWVARREV